LRTGTKGKSVVQLSQEILLKQTNFASLALKSADSLQKFPGIGKDKAATLSALFEISRRIETQKNIFNVRKITTPKDIASIFIPILRDEVKEKFIVVCLNSSNKVIKYEVISVGNLNSSIVHPREVFRVAIDNNSANIIILHNHPSGNPEPSNEDITVTKKLVESGGILDIQVFDHIIIAGDKFTSLVERNLL
jgi:DNA repair protein RadC